MKTSFYLFLCGILAGIGCRLSDFFPYDSLWSLSSVATLFGFWIASVGVITLLSTSGRRAFVNSFLYMFGMTCSFYGLKYILGFFFERFANDGRFPMNLFLIYSVLSAGCGIGSLILYQWNSKHWYRSVLYALPASGLLAEAAGCLFVLITRHMLLGQTLFDMTSALLFGVGLFRKAPNKVLYSVSLLLMAAIVFYVVYKPFLLLI